MKRVTPLLLFVAWSAVVGAAAAGERQSPATVIAPFVDDLTFAVIRFDVPKINPQELIRRVEQLLGPNAPEDRKDLPKMHAKLVAAGAKELYVIFNMADRIEQSIALVPLAGVTDKEALRELIKSAPGAHVVESKGMFVVGPENTVAAVLERQAKAILELAKAFAAVEGAAGQIVVLPPRPFLRAQEELAPNLPKELGGGPITVVTRGFQWAAVGIDVSPKLQLRAVVQAKDAAAAEELQALGQRALNGLVVAGKREAPPLAPLLPLLKPKVEGDRLVLALDDKSIQSVLTPAISQTRLAAARQVSVNNLRQIALAMHNYHDQMKSFPAQASLSQDKKPLLSWRVHILPYLDQEPLYKQFKLDEPWDSAHNERLIGKMPAVYRSPLAKNVAAGKTVYLGAAGPKMVFGGAEGLSAVKITDGTSNTIMIVEANDQHAVPWTQPEDFKPDMKHPKAPLVRKELKGFHAAFADGSIRMLSHEISADLLWRLLTVDGGEAIQEDQPRK